MDGGPLKRQRLGQKEFNPRAGEPVQGHECALLSLPKECLEQCLGKLDACSLKGIAQVCKAFRAFDKQSGLRLLEKIAKTAVLEVSGEQAKRWRRRSWLSRLYIEDCGVGFCNFGWSSSSSPAASPAAGASPPPQYKFMPPASPEAYCTIKLDGMGPKLLVSDLSTADQPFLRWRLAVRGNTAVEFGVVPLYMTDDDKSLHKCQQDGKKFDKVNPALLVDVERPTGFCSSITVGSMLPFKTAIMKGSIVELLARRGRLEILVQNPPDGQELYWHNTRTVPKPYKGPREVRFEQDFSPHHDVKLALTSWAHGAFDVLHPAPGSRAAGTLRLPTAWERQQAAVYGSSSSSCSGEAKQCQSCFLAAGVQAQVQQQDPEQHGSVFWSRSLSPALQEATQQQQQPQQHQIELGIAVPSALHDANHQGLHQHQQQHHPHQHVPMLTGNLASVMLHQAGPHSQQQLQRQCTSLLRSSEMRANMHHARQQQAQHAGQQHRDIALATRQPIHQAMQQFEMLQQQREALQDTAAAGVSSVAPQQIAPGSPASEESATSREGQLMS